MIFEFDWNTQKKFFVKRALFFPFLLGWFNRREKNFSGWRIKKGEERKGRGCYKKILGARGKGECPLLREKFNDITLIDNLIVDCLIGREEFKGKCIDDQ